MQFILNNLSDKNNGFCHKIANFAETFNSGNT